MEDLVTLAKRIGVDRVEMAGFDHGARFGIAAEVTRDGKRYRHAVRCEGALNDGAIDELAAWAKGFAA